MKTDEYTNERADWEEFEERFRNNPETSITALERLTAILEWGLEQAKEESLTDEELYNKIIELREAVTLAMNPDRWAGNLDVFQVYMSRYEEFRQLHRKLTLEAKALQPKLKGIRKRSTPSELFSYKWQGRKEELPELFEKMKGRFIDPGTNLEQFIGVFTGLPVTEIHPIKWLNNATHLLYFILQLQDLELLEKSSRQNYKQLTSCFVQSNGAPFKANFKELKQQVDINLSEEKKREIDDLLKSFS